MQHRSRHSAFVPIACILLALGFAVAVSPAHSIAAPAASARGPPESYTFAFHEADVAQVADEVLGKALGVSYTVDPSITTKISFRIDQRLTRAQLLDAFEATLAANDIVLVRDGEVLSLRPKGKAKSEVAVRGPDESTRRGGYEVVAVPLSWVAPSEISKALDALAPANAVIYTNDKLGIILIGGSGQELESTLQTIKLFDRNGLQGTSVRWFDLTQASAQSVAADLTQVLTGAGVSGVSVVPLKRMNGLLVFAHTPEALDQVGQWVAKLDTPSRETASTLWVYHPRNASADMLAKSLNSVLSGQSSSDDTTVDPGGRKGAPAAPASDVQTGVQATSGASSSQDQVRIGANKDSNTLLIQAPQAQWIQIQRILNEIDRAPDQVLIEASILEVTLTKNFQFGVDWSLLSSGGHLGVSSITNSTGTVSASFPGLAVTFLNKDIQSAINTLGTETAVEVISAPKIMTLDNRTAHLQVGDQVPTVSQTAIGTAAPGAPIVSSISYIATGIILSVTPRISGDDKIVLDVEQEVSSASQTATSEIDSPTIQQRKFESTLVLRDGGVVALGGLISSNKTSGKTGVPGLMSLPWVGSLFRSTTHNSTRTELIVLLSATIVRDTAGADRAMANLLADMQEVQGRGLMSQH